MARHADGFHIQYAMAGRQPHDLRRALSSYVTSLWACFEFAQDVQAVTALLQQAKILLLLGGGPDASVGPDASHSLSASARALEATAPEADASTADQHTSWTARSGNEAEQRAATLVERAQAVQSCVGQSMQPDALQLVFWGMPFAELAAVLLSGAGKHGDEV